MKNIAGLAIQMNSFNPDFEDTPKSDMRIFAETELEKHFNELHKKHTKGQVETIFEGSKKLISHSNAGLLLENFVANNNLLEPPVESEEEFYNDRSSHFTK